MTCLQVEWVSCLHIPYLHYLNSEQLIRLFVHYNNAILDNLNTSYWQSTETQPYVVLSLTFYICRLWCWLIVVELRREVPLAQSAVCTQLFALSCLLLVVCQQLIRRLVASSIYSLVILTIIAVQSLLLLTGWKELVTLNTFRSCWLTKELQGR